MSAVIPSEKNLRQACQHYHAVDQKIWLYENSGARSVRIRNTISKIIEFVIFSLGLLWIAAAVYNIPTWATIGVGFGGAIILSFIKLALDPSIAISKAEYEGHRTIKAMMQEESFHAPIGRETIDIFDRSETKPQRAFVEAKYAIPSKTFPSDRLCKDKRLGLDDNLNKTYLNQELEDVVNRYDLEIFNLACRAEIAARHSGFSEKARQLNWRSIAAGVAKANTYLAKGNFAAYSKKIDLSDYRDMLVEPDLSPQDPSSEEMCRFEIEHFQKKIAYAAKIVPRVQQEILNKIEKLKLSKELKIQLADQFFKQVEADCKEFEKSIVQLYEECHQHSSNAKHLFRKLGEMDFSARLQQLIFNIKKNAESVKTEFENNLLVKVCDYEKKLQSLIKPIWIKKRILEEHFPEFDLLQKLLQDKKSQALSSQDLEKIEKDFLQLKMKFQDFPLARIQEYENQLLELENESYSKEFRKKIDDAFEELIKLKSDFYTIGDVKVSQQKLNKFVKKHLETLKILVRYGSTHPTLNSLNPFEKKKLNHSRESQERGLSKEKLVQNVNLRHFREHQFARELQIEREIAKLDNRQIWAIRANVVRLDALVFLVSNIVCCFFTTNPYAVLGMLTVGYLSNYAKDYAATWIQRLDIEKAKLRMKKTLYLKRSIGAVPGNRTQLIQLKKVTNQLGIDGFEETASSLLIEGDKELPFKKRERFQKEKEEQDKLEGPQVENPLATTKIHAHEVAKAKKEKKWLSNEVEFNSLNIADLSSKRIVLEKKIERLNKASEIPSIINNQFSEAVGTHAEQILSENHIQLSSFRFCPATFVHWVQHVFNLSKEWQIQFSGERICFRTSPYEQFLLGLYHFKQYRPARRQAGFSSQEIKQLTAQIERFTLNQDVRNALKTVLLDNKNHEACDQELKRFDSLKTALETRLKKSMFTPKIMEVLNDIISNYEAWLPHFNDFLEQRENNTLKQKKRLQNQFSEQEAQLLVKSFRAFYRIEQPGWEKVKSMFESVEAGQLQLDEKIRAKCDSDEFRLLETCHNLLIELKKFPRVKQALSLGRQLNEEDNSCYNNFVKHFKSELIAKFNHREREQFIQALKLTIFAGQVKAQGEKAWNQFSTYQFLELYEESSNTSMDFEEELVFYKEKLKLVFHQIKKNYIMTIKLIDRLVQLDELNLKREDEKLSVEGYKLAIEFLERFIQLFEETRNVHHEVQESYKRAIKLTERLVELYKSSNDSAEELQLYQHKLNSLRERIKNRVKKHSLHQQT